MLVIVPDDDSGQRKRDFRTTVADVKAIAMGLAMEAESVLGRKTARVLGLLVLFAVVVGILLALLDWYIAPTDAEQKQALVVTLAQILGGAALLSGLYFTWRTLQVNREGQITERFTRAIDQLGAADDDGNPRLEIRLGGIYALERIARDSARDYGPVMEVLTAYVRENTRQSPGPSEGASEAASTPNEATAEVDEGAKQPAPPALPRPTADIQAILDVLVLTRARVPEEYRTHLDLHEAFLQGAFLRGADLQGADLKGTFLQGADLRGASGITQNQIESTTIGSSETELPEGLNRPKLWSKSLEEQFKLLRERSNRAE